MAGIRELYERVYNALYQVQKSDVVKKANKQRIAETKQRMRNEQIQAIENEIAHLLPFRSASAVYVDPSLQRKGGSPRPANKEELERLYRIALTGGGDWTLLYQNASDGIAWLENEKLRLASESIPLPDNTSSEDANNACRRILQSKDTDDLLAALQALDEVYAPAIFIKQNYAVPPHTARPPLGKVAMSFPITDGCVAIAKQLFGVYFIEEQRLLLIPAVVPAVTLIQTKSCIAEKVMCGIRAYAFSLLYHSAPAPRKVYYIDTCKYDAASLGVLQPYADGPDYPIARVACNAEEMRRQLSELREHTLQNPRQRLLVFRYRQEMLDRSCEANLQWLCANAQHYDLQILMVQEVSNTESALDRLVPWYIPEQTKILRSISDKYVEDNDYHRRVVWYLEPTEIPQRIVTAMLDAYQPEPILTRYFDVCPQSHSIQYIRDRKKTVSLLYGVGESGKKYSLDLKGMDFAAYILGASRSGKSNMLNILITSAILNYHPDDLELWLVDFGRTEFKRYTQHTPPHVRYILIEKTTELVCSLVQSLVDEMERRGRIMSQHNVQDMSDLPESVHMPRLLVLIDEFGAFKAILTADSFDEKRTYRSHMEQLLRQGAKHGMNFIFSDQSFTDTYKALPEEGQEQIGLRITMKADIDEMKSILQVRGRQLTEQEDTTISSLPKYQALFRSRESGGQLSESVHVLYFTEQDKDQQLSLIDRINALYTPNGTARSNPFNQYVAHDQLCLDRDATPTFEALLKSIADDINSWKHNDAYLSSDVLLYLGEPRNMRKIQHELLRSSRAENLLIYGNYERNLHGIASVLHSVERSATLQQIPVEYWCDDHNVIASRYLKSASNVIRDHDTIAMRVHDIRNSLQSKIPEPRIVILLGIDAIISAIQDDIDEAALFASYSQQSDEDRERQRLRDLMAGKASDNKNVAARPIVNIKEYLNGVLDFAPKKGIHFVVVIQSEDNLDDAAISLQSFGHRMGFPSGVRDSQNFKFKRFVEGISEGDMFGFMSRTGTTVYMPFAMADKKEVK